MQLIASHDLKHLYQVVKMNLDIDELTLSATVDKDVIEVTWRKVAKLPSHLRHHSIKSGWCILQFLRHHQPLPYHITQSTHPCEWYVAKSHQNVVEAIGWIDGTEDDASLHGLKTISFLGKAFAQK